MKAILPVALILLTIACGGVKPAKIDFHLPELKSNDFSDFYYREGWENLKKGDTDVAFNLFQRSEVSLEKKYVAFGYVFLARKKFSAATGQFTQALEKNPENLEAAIGLATIYELEEKITEAYQYYGKLLTRAPDNAWVKLRYENIKASSTQKYLLQAESYKNIAKEKYIQALQQAAFFSPEMTAITLQIAAYYYQENQWDRSLPFYEAVLEKEPYNQEVLLKLAAIYEKNGKFDLALVTLDRLLGFNPGDTVLEGERKRIREQFQEMNLPEKFKKIFFKTEINREEMAALIGFYFDRYIKMDQAPEIITDIDGSFAKEYIMRTCTSGIMDARPDHTFDRFSIPDRATFAVILKALIDYLEKNGHTLHFTPLAIMVESIDLSPLHKNYEIIKYIVNAQILPLDSERIFNPKEKSYVETSLPLDMSKLMPKEMAPMMAMMKMTVKVTSNGQTQKINNWNCSGYDVDMSVSMMQMKMKVWATTDVPFDWKAFAKMYTNVYKMSFMDDAALAELMKINGYQVASEMTMNMMGANMKVTTQVVEIAKKDAPAGVYAVPPGFIKKDLLSLQDLRGGK